MAKPALSAATARSQLATSWQPAAVARPCTRATTGWGIDWMVSIIRVQVANSWRACSRSVPAISAKSWPAENTGPLAASTTPSASLSPTAVNAAVRLRSTSSDSALRFSGWSRVTRTNGPCRSMVTASDMAPHGTPAPCRAP